MCTHLPILHDIIVTSVQQFHNVPTLNNILADLMQQLLDQRALILNNDSSSRSTNRAYAP